MRTYTPEQQVVIDQMRTVWSTEQVDLMLRVIGASPEAVSDAEFQDLLKAVRKTVRAAARTNPLARLAGLNLNI